jgi:hypothetical protein
MEAAMVSGASVVSASSGMRSSDMLASAGTSSQVSAYAKGGNGVQTIVCSNKALG